MSHPTFVAVRTLDVPSVDSCSFITVVTAARAPLGADRHRRAT
ncbi:hypothetical protein [Streptomyces sp. NPDC050535]